MFEAILFIVALGALPALLVWAVAYLLLPRRRWARVGAVLLTAALMAAPFWPLVLFVAPSLLVALITIGALEMATRARTT